MAKGYVAMILHAHLPFVHHPELKEPLEERWLFEAISESYIPLLNTFSSLVEEEVDFRLTLSLSPSLISMLINPLLQERYINYLHKLIELSGKEIERTHDQTEYNRLAHLYHNKYIDDLDKFLKVYDRNLVQAFKKFQDMGKLEIITCTATHGFLPLMSANPEAIHAQIAAGVQVYEKHFCRKPKGIWLPECGYIPMVEKALVQNGIEYFILESHGILYADPRPVFGTYAPIVTTQGVAAFGRDTESSWQVWSATEGYPGDFDYREFYRDIGFDLDYEYIRDYISPDGTRIHTGIKYHRITEKSGNKQPYNPERARNKVDAHSSNFMFSREKQIEHLSGVMDRPPIIVCPYDAELFGHWWYEGPQWLYSLFKKTAFDQETFKLITPGEYIAAHPVMQVCNPCPSSWGYKGYNEVWLSESNEWIYRHLLKAAGRMTELARDYPYAQGLIRKALNQAARELLLAQSSDWAFIMRAGTMVSYAEKRTREHIERFTKLYHDIKSNRVEEKWLEEIRMKDDLFPDLDYSVYR